MAKGKPPKPEKAENGDLVEGEVLEREPLNAAKSERHVPAVLLANQWKPGQSGNPGGKTKLELEVRRMAQDSSAAVMEKIIDICLTTDEDRVAVVAGQIVLERAFGKPKESMPGDDPSAGKPDLTRLSQKELGNLRKLLLKSVGKGEGGPK